MEVRNLPSIRLGYIVIVALVIWVVGFGGLKTLGPTVEVASQFLSSISPFAVLILGMVLGLVLQKLRVF